MPKTCSLLDNPARIQQDTEASRMTASEFPEAIREMRARLSASRARPDSRMGTNGQNEAERQYREEVPLMDALRCTAFQHRRVLAGPPANLVRLQALIERQEQNILDYEAWVSRKRRTGCLQRRSGDNRWLSERQMSRFSRSRD